MQLSLTAMDEFKIPKLNGENYTAWSIRTRAALVQKNCWEAIEPGYGAELKDSERKTNEKALTFLFLTVEDEFLDDIADYSRAKDAWNSLKDIHTKFGLLHTLQLLKEFFNVTMKPGESMNSYLGRLMELHRKVSSCGYGFTDRELALVMLMGLPKEYEGLILTLERDEEALSSKTVKSRLIVEEKKLLRHCSEVNSEAVRERALKTKDRGKLREQEVAKKLNKNNERKTRCFSCGGWGHIARNCSFSRTKNIRAKMASDAEYHALFADTSDEKSTCDWYLDSGATEHMCSLKQKFFNFEKIRSKVEIANSEKIEVVGTGDIILKPSKECGKKTIFLKNVLYVPNLDSNLLSAGRIEEMGMTISFEGGRAIIKDQKEGKIILTAHRCGRLYKIREEQAHKAFISKNEELWHRRLGHPHLNIVKELNSDISRKKSNSESSELCSICIQGKMKRHKFPKTSHKGAKEVLEIIHSDVIGKISPPSLGGSNYLVTFTDDFSHYTVVYPMKTKNEVLEKFDEYRRMAENLHGKNIKILRSDNGGEFKSERFNEYLTKLGIQRQLTVPESPQQNGVSERMNQTLINTTRCLLIESGLHPRFWAEAITTAAYLRNKCPSAAIGGNIPEEIWSGKKVRTEHLRVYGCRAWSHVRSYSRCSKFDPKSKECVHVGYPDGIKGYKLWDPKENKFFISRDVIFEENIFPFKMEQHCKNSEKQEYITLHIENEEIEDDTLLTKAEVQRNSTEKRNQNSEFPIEKKKECLDQLQGKLSDNKIEDCSNQHVEEVINCQEEVKQAEPITEFTVDKLVIPRSDDDGIAKNTELLVNTEEPRRSNRIRRPKTYYGDPVLYKVVSEKEHIVQNKDPTSLKEAMESPHAEMWRDAMKEELNNLYRNQTWELVPRPANVKPIGCKWVFKKKLNASGEVTKFKARLVAKGYSQIPGRDFSETFSPVVKIKSLRILLALVVELDMEVHQMDITAAYLNGTLKEDIYMQQPEGFLEQDKEHLVCHLKRSLYGLKQSGREWNTCFDIFLKDYGLVRSKSDPCIYYHPNKLLYLGIYVDDMLIVGTLEAITNFKLKVVQRFQARDLGEANEILSMRIQRQADGSLALDQTTYIEEILENFEANAVKGASTPLDPNAKHHKVTDDEWSRIKEESDKIPYRQAIGSLLYLACGTRPDIAFSATYMSQFNERPSQLHWRSIKHLFRYLKETKSLSLTYRKTGRAVDIFSDADWGADHIDRKSFSGYVAILGGAAISWSSKKQCSVALSSAEAEYIAIAHALKEVLWIRGLLQELGAENFIPVPVSVKVDNQAAIFMARNQITSERSKHIDIRYHFIRDHVEQKLIDLKYVNSKNNVADLLTKNISKKVLLILRKFLGFSK